MTSARHTPGPWNVDANSWKDTAIYDRDGVTVCRLDLDDWAVTEETQDELEKAQHEVASLIAAAPEMLYALKACVSDADGRPEMQHSVTLAKAIIAKAEGRTP